MKDKNFDVDDGGRRRSALVTIATAVVAVAKTVFCVVNDFHGFYRRPSMAVDGRRKRRKITVFIDEQYLYIFIDGHRKRRKIPSLKMSNIHIFCDDPVEKTVSEKADVVATIDGRRKRRKIPSLKMSNIHIFLRRPRRKNRLRKNRRRRDDVATVDVFDARRRWSSSPSQKKPSL